MPAAGEDPDRIRRRSGGLAAAVALALGRLGDDAAATAELQRALGKDGTAGSQRGRGIRTAAAGDLRYGRLYGGLHYGRHGRWCRSLAGSRKLEYEFVADDLDLISEKKIAVGARSETESAHELVFGLC